MALFESENLFVCVRVCVCVCVRASGWMDVSMIYTKLYIYVEIVVDIKIWVSLQIT